MLDLAIGFWPALGLFGLASVGLSLIAVLRDKPLNWTFSVPVPLPKNGPARFETVLDYAAPSGQAHSATIHISHETATVMWFQGSKEAQADVDIHGLTLAKDTNGQWRALSDPAALITRADLGNAFEPSQLVITLGNVVQNDSVADRLFATVVSLGGWAMASIADVSLSAGRPHHVRKLNLSPLLGRSHLVKSPMVAYGDGSHGLPAYYEVNYVFSELVRFDAQGRVRDKRRMTKGEQAIQPMIVPLGPDRAIAFMRNYLAETKRQLVRLTRDGGRTWAAQADCGLPNPQAPVAALSLGDGRILIAFNDDETRSDLMRLALSDDEGQSWRRIHTLEDGNGDAQAACRYPVMRALPDGNILLTYSADNKRKIRAHLFNQAWVDAQ